MILLVSPHAEVLRQAEVFSQALGQPVHSTDNLEQASVVLRSHEYGAIVFDQMLVDSEPDKAETVSQLVDMAIPIYINFGVSRLERSIKLIKSALVRRQKDLRSAKRQAQEKLNSEMNDLLTGLLLSCELALESSKFPEMTLQRIEMVHKLALQIKANLAVVS